ncbi:hypothetical protein PFNF135_03998 [Plasmodium falciparum NF135/5.C10]|uniref:Phospholipid-transporting ATPase n=1 Tax=Plasmodium falciparum NF135/5.C10 TaxID=1036726 RepID=W4ID13_PLAFA|nr:hypothetical protein PFNF135_03998 [Plasmodium falciparum NF135/5.C10]
MSLVYRKTLNFLKGKNEDDKDVKININGENKRTCNNSVITSKYTVFNFIFLNMYEQFHKISNVYFFFIGILQVIPQFTATNGIPTVFFPLLIVLTANAIKDAFEDWNRHKTDKIENNRMCYGIVSEEEKKIYQEKSNKKNIFKKLKRYFFGNRKICNTENYYDEDDMYDDEITDINDYINNYEDNLENIEGTVKKRWKDIKAGDIILCRRSEFFCADILLLCTSHKNGIAFVETSSLDGETNLKVKEANTFLFNILGNDRNSAIDNVKNLKGFILSDKPNKDLSTMYGTIYFEKDKKIDVENIGIQELLKKTTEEIEYRKKRLSSVDLSKSSSAIGSNLCNNNNKSDSKSDIKNYNKDDDDFDDMDENNILKNDNYIRIPFDEKQFVLRGCKLKNTDWIMGIVIYVGRETKIQMNSSKSIKKTSKLEILTNKMTIIIWVIQMIICLISAYYNAIIVSSSRKNRFRYLPFNLEKAKKPYIVGIISFFSWVVITGNFVPISLIVTMSFVKVVQAYFISCDKNMIHKVQADVPSFGEQKEIPNIPKDDISSDADVIKRMRTKKIADSSLLHIDENQTEEDNMDMKSDCIAFKNNSSHQNINGNNKQYSSSSLGIISNAPKREISSRVISFKDSKEKNYIYFNAVPRTSSLIEELGQIEYIFSDKTGTLTCNIMEFRKCAINGISYGKGLTEIKRNILKKKNLEIPVEPTMKFKKKTPHVNIIDNDIINHLKDPNHFNHVNLINFFLHLAINHAVICEKDKEGVTTYSSSSPDEEALVNAAKHFDITFLYRREGKYGISIFGKIYEIDTLATIEFTSKRKMSSVICRIPVINPDYNHPTDAKSSNMDKKKNNMDDHLVVGKNEEKEETDDLNVYPPKKEAHSKLNNNNNNNNNIRIDNLYDDKNNFNIIYNHNEGRTPEVITCKNSKNSKIMLFCKGAGSIILKKLAKRTDVDEITIEHMETYADEGLRTLCIAQRELSEESFAEWYHLYKEASLSIKDREEKLESVAEYIENDLILQGITGIEDKLQEGVSSTIEDLRMAGIHIWMLTGDKIETAMNIGIAANLIDNYSEQFIYTEEYIESEEALIKKIDDDILMVEKSLNIPHYNFDDENNNVEDEKRKTFFRNNFIKNFFCAKNKSGLLLNPDKYNMLINTLNYVLVVDGSVIDLLLSEKMERKFFYLADKCSSVICGRVSPYQKGAIVSSANRLLNKITLAIGDGANDRNMINTANIGIGIRGQEGVQAFNSSDYGISQFRFLKNLLLVHGRLSYRRISKLVVYMFYKNMVLIFPLFIFGSISLYSGQKIYFEFLLHLFNVLFTAIPVVIHAVLDQDISLNTAMEKPNLYKLGIHHYYFNIRTFISWVMNSLFHGSVVFLIPLYFLSYYNIPTSDGIPYDIWTVGCATYFLTVLIVNFKILFETYYLNILPISGIALSIFSFVLLVTAFSFMCVGSIHLLGTIVYLVQSLRFWLVVILGLFTALLRDYVFKVYKRNFNPEIYHLLLDQENAKIGMNDVIDQLKLNEFDKDDDIRIEKSKSLGYAFSEADPACIQLIRKQDNMI